MRWRAAAALAAVSCVVVLAVSAGSFGRRQYRRTLRARHAARGETELLLVSSTASRLSLHRAGASLDAAAELPIPTGECWLPAGRYFVAAALDGRAQLFPVTLDPPVDAPGGEPRWTVAVRQVAAEEPPRLDERAPGFVFVPGGSFVLGDRHNPGQPHEVWLPSFYLAAFEVTNREFRAFLADPRGYGDRSNWTEAGWGWKARVGGSQSTASLTAADARFQRFGRDELPVVLVSWHEASAYGRWLTRRLGRGRWLYRMPTEAEWEKAARGPDAFDYGLGMELSEPQAGLYNWRKNPGAAVTLVAADTAGFRPNRYGVLHASGNAREWTQSLFRHYNARQPYREDGRNADDASGMRVTRGGSWYSASAVRLQLAYREEFQPELLSDDLGFRVAAVLGAGDGAGTR